MLFPLREDYTTSVTGTAVAETKQIKLPRLFHIEALMVRVSVVVNGAIATANADGLYGFLKKVTLQVSHGANTRNVVSVSGRALQDLSQHWLGGNDNNYITNVAATGAATYVLYYPIWCAHPQCADPLGSAFMLPAPAYNDDPTLTLEFSNQAEMDANGAPTFTITSYTADVIVKRREVLGELETVNWELVENEVTYATSGTEIARELAVPGHYTGILLRCYTTAAARGNVFSGPVKLQALGQVIRRFRPADLAIWNDLSRFNPAIAPTAGNYYMDFLSDKVGSPVLDLGSCLDTNPLVGTGAKLELLQDITGGAAVRIRYVHHRIFGDISKYKLTRSK